MAPILLECGMSGLLVCVCVEVEPRELSITAAAAASQEAPSMLTSSSPEAVLTESILCDKLLLFSILG